MRIWIRPCMGVGGSQSGDIVAAGCIGFSDWLAVRLLPGSTWTGWQDYVALYQHKSTKRKRRFGGDKDNLVFYLAGFLWPHGTFGADILSWSPKHIWPCLSLRPHFVPFSHWICALLPKWLSFSQPSGFWAFLVSKIFMFLLCVGHCGLSFLCPCLNPTAQFRFTQSSGLGFNVIFSEKPSLNNPISSARFD